MSNKSELPGQITARAIVEAVHETWNAALREAINVVNGCDRISEVQPAIEKLIKKGGNYE